MYVSVSLLVSQLDMRSWDFQLIGCAFRAFHCIHCAISLRNSCSSPVKKPVHRFPYCTLSVLTYALHHGNVLLAIAYHLRLYKSANYSMERRAFDLFSTVSHHGFSSCCFITNGRRIFVSNPALVFFLFFQSLGPITWVLSLHHCRFLHHILVENASCPCYH